MRVSKTVLIFHGAGIHLQVSVGLILIHLSETLEGESHWSRLKLQKKTWRVGKNAKGGSLRPYTS